MAFLAILPKAPEALWPRGNYDDRAIARRNCGARRRWTTTASSPQAAGGGAPRPARWASCRRSAPSASADAGYFLEEVRRELIDRSAKQAEDGPQQRLCRRAVGAHFARHRIAGCRAQRRCATGCCAITAIAAGPGRSPRSIPSKGDLTSQLRSSYLSASITRTGASASSPRAAAARAQIGFADGEEAPLDRPARRAQGRRRDRRVARAATAGDVRDRSRSLGRVRGAWTRKPAGCWRCRAGSISRLGSFNRATQADRQPGSTIKPFVYATGLDNGMTPATMVPDSAVLLLPGRQPGREMLPQLWRQPRRGRAHDALGARAVAEPHDRAYRDGCRAWTTSSTRSKARHRDAGDYEPYPAFALGAGDTTVERMVNAYAALVNHGRLQRSHGDRLCAGSPRQGDLARRQARCTGCNMAEWDGKPMPRFGRQRQAGDGCAHRLPGPPHADRRGAARHRDAPARSGHAAVRQDRHHLPARPMSGSSADRPTSSAATYVGFDQPRNMGGWIQGGNTAAPIFKQFVEETRDRWTRQAVPRARRRADGPHRPAHRQPRVRRLADATSRLLP